MIHLYIIAGKTIPVKTLPNYQQTTTVISRPVPFSFKLFFKKSNNSNFSHGGTQRGLRPKPKNF
jgi:hypothetical protein